MKPGARVQAAIEVLDRVIAGGAAERELTAWARRSRFAGSKDRAAVRDHVFDALRRLRSSAWRSGLGDGPLDGFTGRAVMAGLLVGQGTDPDMLFTGEGHAPAPFGPMPEVAEMPRGVACDCPDWLLPEMDRSLGGDADAVLTHLRDRAPAILRANAARISRDDLLDRLSAEGLDVAAHPLSPTAIEVRGRARGLTALAAYTDGLFELQDAGSQALVDRLPDMRDARVLDLCAGGGGKSLAVAARGVGALVAHDADARRMADLPARAQRAGARITTTQTPEDLAPFDGVIADVPCSGSGSWRRVPEAKWRLDAPRLHVLTDTQAEILARAVALTRSGGWIGYMTCSLLACENGDQIDRALAEIGGLSVEQQWRCSPLDGADGFYLTVLQKT